MFFLTHQRDNLVYRHIVSLMEHGPIHILDLTLPARNTLFEVRHGLFLFAFFGYNSIVKFWNYEGRSTRWYIFERLPNDLRYLAHELDPLACFQIKNVSY